MTAKKLDLYILHLLEGACNAMFDCEVIFTRFDEDNMSIVLSQIISKNPGNGKGTYCINYINFMLEAYGIKKLQLLAKPIAENYTDLDVMRLSNWYHKHGLTAINIQEENDKIMAVEMERRWV